MSRLTNTDIPPEEEPEKDLGRKPYYEEPRVEGLPFKQALKSGSPDGGSYGAMMSRTNYIYSKQAQLQHSQFKKPYMDEEFPEMEGYGDYLELIEYDDWDITIDFEMQPGEDGGTNPIGGTCFVVCHSGRARVDWSDDCSDLKVYFHGYAHEPGDRVDLIESSHGASKDEGGEWFGAFFYPQVFTFSSVPEGETVEATFFQAIHEVCPAFGPGYCKKVISETQDCCTLEYDTTNSEFQFARGDSGTIYVIGGDGDYEWSLDGACAGWSLDDATTAIPQNTLNCNATTGTGAVTITVTSCGQTAVGYAYCTNSGTWTLIETATSPGDACGVENQGEVHVPPAHQALYYYGKWYIEENTTEVSGCFDTCTTCKARLSALQKDFCLHSWTIGGFSEPCYGPICFGSNIKYCVKMSSRKRYERTC
jgi:hypothetical protein